MSHVSIFLLYLFSLIPYLVVSLSYQRAVYWSTNSYHSDVVINRLISRLCIINLYLFTAHMQC